MPCRVVAEDKAMGWLVETVRTGSGYVKMKRTGVKGAVKARQRTLGMDAQGLVEIGP